MNILYFSSDAFVPVLAVSAVSLLENNRQEKSTHFYIIDDGISRENREKLQSLLEGYGAGVTYILAPDPREIFGFPFESRYQMGHSYPRMCIGQLLPQNLERVLCLDSDTLVLGDLGELWGMDLAGNIMAGVSDCMNLKSYGRRFWLEPNQLYCNAGVYLVDLKKWRQEKVFDAICSRIRQQKGNVFFFEQTLMNWGCRGKILRLHPKYNVYTLFYAFDYENLLRLRRPTDFYSRQQVREALAHPVILHFTRNFYMLSRPWAQGCDHPMARSYQRYKALTPWPQLSPPEPAGRRGLYRKLPISLVTGLAQIAYNTVRPILWWKNE